MSERRRSERGAVAHYIVITAAISLAGIVATSASNIGSFAREERRLATSDEAFALAESGVAVARRALETESLPLAGAPTTTTLLDHEPLGRGSVTVAVTHWVGERGLEHATVVSTGTVPAPLVAGKGGTITRRIEARLERSPAAKQPADRTPEYRHSPAVVVGWKEL